MPAMPAGGGGLADLGALAQGPDAGGGADQGRAGLEDFIGKIRDLDTQVSSVLGSMPAAAQEAQQIKAVLKRLIMKAAQMAPTQTKSSDAVPTAGA